MASDEEIARQVRRREEGLAGGDGALREDLQTYRETAGEIHDELARRIRDVDQDAASEADLDAVVERLDRLDDRLDDLEARLEG